MRIVDYNTFIRMPAGTIFAPFKRCVFLDHLEVKVDHGYYLTNHKGDGRWVFNGTMPLEPWNKEDLYEDGESVKATFEVYDGDSNDASMYDWFCVFEPDDIDELIKVLHWAKDGCPGELEDYKKESEN